MTDDDIMLMALDAGPLTQGSFTEWCKRFAALVAAAERVACAKVVDAAKAGEEDWDSNDWNQAVEFCASRIRARS